MTEKTYYISGSCIYTKTSDDIYEAFGCVVNVDGVNLIVNPYDQTYGQLMTIPEEYIGKLKGYFKTKYR